MKKLIVLLVLTLVFIMSGCGEEKPETWSNWEKDKYCNSYLFDEYDNEPVCIEYLEYIESQTYYTQEEVDGMLIQEFWIEECFEQYCICRVHEEGHDYCTVMANNNAWSDEFYTKSKLDEGFEDVLLYLQALEARIEELEAQNEPN